MDTYINYDIRVTQRGQLYDLHADCPLAGQATGHCQPPFSKTEIDILCWGDTAIQSDPKEIGQRLYDAIFQDSIGIHFHKCLGIAEAQGNRLRIRLRLSESPELARLPWEYLYDTDGDEFFALSIQTPIVRYLDIRVGESPLAVEGVVNVLVILADPTDVEPRLAVEQEWEQFQTVFQDLELDEKIKLHRLPNATTLDLQRYLRRNQIDILHFIGHGHFDQQREEGFLIFENQKGQAQMVSADVLARLLDDKMPRLIYLNSCDTARTGLLDPLTGTAQELVQHGAPAVVAMQTAIQDQKAIEIAHEFYLALMDGYPVDAALVEGRKAVFNTHEMAEWGTPVLFMRAPDGEIFKRTEEINLEPDEEFFTSGSLTDEEGKIRQNYRILMRLEDSLLLDQETNPTKIHSQIEHQKKRLKNILCQYWLQTKTINWPLPPDIRAMIYDFKLTSKKSGCAG